MLRCLTLSKKTLKTIVDSKNNYLVQVKANRSKLYKEINHITLNNFVKDSHITIERVNGRTDHRLIEIYPVLDGQITGDWSDCQIKIVVKVYRWDSTSTKEKTEKRKGKNYKNKKKTEGIHYYILNKAFHRAETLGEMIRNHWKIENALHWVKDFYLKEDQMTITKKSAAALLATFNNIAVNQIRKAGEKPSVAFFEKIINNIPLIYKIIRT